MMQLRPRFEDKCGHPLAGGNVFAFEAGTSNPKATYADAEGTIPNTHPIKLDYRGEADIFLLSGRYRFVVYSCTGVKIYDVDDVGEWLGTLTADRVIDGDKTQHQINSEQALTNTELSESIANEKERAELAEAALDTTINNESIRAVAAEQALDTKIAQEAARALSVEGGLQTQINNLGGGVFGFMTYAAFDAVKATIAANSVVVIGEPNNTGTGSWGQGDNIWNGTVLTKSPYDPYTQAVAQSLINSKNEDLKATANFGTNSSTDHYQFADVNGNIISTLDQTGTFNAPDFKSTNGSLNTVASVTSIQSLGNYTHALYDAEGNILFGLQAGGSFSTAYQSMKYGIAEIRAGAVPDSLIQAAGRSLDTNYSELDTPNTFEIEVSPYQADGTQAQRMAAAIKIGPNKLYVAFTQFSTYNNDQQDGRLVARIVDYDLVNKTATVSETIPIIGNKTGNNYRHPQFVRLKDRILLIFNGNTPDLLVYESFDNCATWQFKTQIDTSSIAEMPWALALDSVVRIEEGRYAGRIVAGLFYYNLAINQTKIGSVYSDDNGATWHRGFTLNSVDYFPTYPTLNEMSVACDAHNDLIFAIRNETLATEARYIIFAKSTDGGETLQFFNQNIKTPTVGVQIGLKQVAPSSFGGGVPKIIATHPIGNNRTQFMLRVSYDGCQSWAFDYKPWPLTDMIGYSSLIPLSAKDYALVVEKGPMLKEQSIAIKFLNLKEIM